MSQPENNGWGRWLAPLLVGVVLCPLLVGYEPVGGDPDRIFRPIKFELANALRSGTLPFWCDKLGLGVPLLAESQAAALYPPNHILYRAFDVATAYRLSMWLHGVLAAAAAYAYARFLNICRPGATLAGVSFALCGFQAIHSSHEWAYHTLAYVPLVLLATEKYLDTGRLLWMAALALASGIAWTLGHFQIQTWTCVIAGFITIWRVLADKRVFVRSTGVMLSLWWGGLVAAAQLGPSWELAQAVGQENRDRIFYSFPPQHWAELAIPRLFRGLKPEAPYWFQQQTTGFEACLYVGTIPLILVFAGLLSRDRQTAPWKAIAAATFALATMPRWWPQGYQYLLMIPGVGLFRCPARWTAFTSLGLALLAGRGADGWLSRARFWFALGAAATFGAAALIHGYLLRDHASFTRRHLDSAMISAACVWGLSLALVVASRLRPKLRALLVLGCAIELGYLYYHMTTQWGLHISLPQASPALARLAEEPAVGVVGGEIDNLPLWAGIATANAYTGFRPFGPNESLARLAQSSVFPPYLRAQLRRVAISHLLVRRGEALAHTYSNRRLSLGSESIAGWEVVWIGTDHTLSRVTRVPESSNNNLTTWATSGGDGFERPLGTNEDWVLLRIPGFEPGPIVANRAIMVSSETEATHVARNLAGANSPAIVGPSWHQEAATLNQSPATQASVRSWTRTSAVVEHDGACILIMPQANFRGWQSRVTSGPWLPLMSVNGGFQAVFLQGAALSRIELRYAPSGWPIVATASLTATAVALAACAWSLALGSRACHARAETAG
jgi:hypothetical protein